MSTALQPYASTQFCVGFLTASIWLLKPFKWNSTILLLFVGKGSAEFKETIKDEFKSGKLCGSGSSKCFNSKRANEVPKSRIYLVLTGPLAWASNHSKAVYSGWGSGANTKQHISCSKQHLLIQVRREGLACIHRFWTELWKSSCGLQEWHLTEWHL